MVSSYWASKRCGLGVPSLLQKHGLCSKVKIPNSWLISKLSNTHVFQKKKKNANNNNNLNQFLLHLFGVAGYLFVSGITATIDCWISSYLFRLFFRQLITSNFNFVLQSTVCSFHSTVSFQQILQTYYLFYPLGFPLWPFSLHFTE